MIHDAVIVVAFNARLEDGCDYATQTMDILGRNNKVFGFLLGEPISWRNVFRKVMGLTHQKVRLIERQYQSVLVRPFFIIPGQRWPWIRTLNYVVNAVLLWLYIQVRFSQQKKLLWFFEPHHMTTLARVFGGFYSVYDCVDYYQELGTDWKKSEDVLLREADVVVFNSQTLYKQHWIKRPEASVVPLGFSQAPFRMVTRKIVKTNFKGRTIGYIGGINYRLDFDLLFSLLRVSKDYKFVFVGPIQLNLIPGEDQTRVRIEKLWRLPNVQYLGNYPKEKIAQVIVNFDICIIPYDLRYAFNRYCYPMKLLEYFYLGKPVVATPIQELTNIRFGVRLARTAHDFRIEMKQIFQTGWPNSIQAAQRKHAQSHTWERKLEAISRILAREI